ncbi:MAG: EI24 domain-containing protein [Gallionellaceae bacterium]
MKDILRALLVALQTLIHPKMLALILWPMLVAIVVWAGAAIFFWESWIGSLTSLVQATPLEQWMMQGFFAIVSHYFIVIVLMMLLLPAVYVTALLITAIFAMPMMVSHVAKTSYPELQLKQGGSTVGSVVNAVIAILVYCTGWLLTMPLWLFSPLALLLPIILMAYLNQRLFRYDALAEHASKEEYEQLMQSMTVKLYLLGAVLSLLQFIPLLNLFSPIYVALAFIHLCLAELKKLRQQT